MDIGCCSLATASQLICSVAFSTVSTGCVLEQDTVFLQSTQLTNVFSEKIAFLDRLIVLKLSREITLKI